MEQAVARKNSLERSHKGWTQVYETLQVDILFGRVLPRERLVEDDLIARFDATRHAVRRALDELEREGLVQRQPNRGARVRDYSRKEVEDLYQIRTALEERAASLVPLPGDPAYVETLKTLAARHERASREQRYLDLSRLNNEFHEALYGGAGNPELSAAIRHYSLMTQPIRSRGFSNSELRETAIREHWQMVSTIESADRTALLQLCRVHIEGPKDYYLKTNPGL